MLHINYKMDSTRLCEKQRTEAWESCVLILKDMPLKSRKKKIDRFTEFLHIMIVVKQRKKKKRWNLQILDQINFKLHATYRQMKWLRI